MKTNPTNDCGPYAISKCFKISLSKAASLIHYQPSIGTLTRDITDFLKGKGWEERKIPRRGQERMNGIVWFHKRREPYYHVTVVQKGIVYDREYPLGCSISFYRQRYKYHVVLYYSPNL